MATRKMNLLWVFPSFKAGGAQRRFVSLVSALGDDYSHGVVAMDGAYDAEKMIPATVEWRRVEVGARKPGAVSLGGMWSFRRLLSRERPDVLITSNWGTLEWLLVNRGPGSAPHVHFEDGYEPDEGPGNLNSSRSWARRRAYPGRDRTFIAPSREMSELLSSEWGAPKEAVELIPHGIDVDLYSASQRDGARGAVRFGSVGALRPEKRYDRLLKLAAGLKERGRAAEVMLVGDGPERGALERLAGELGIAETVHFVGAQADVPAYLEQMDVFALTSDVEQAPVSVAEAMASGLPVLATAVGDVPEMVSQANRLFVRSPDDESALLAAAELLCVDPDARSMVGGQNRERAAARFSLEGMVARIDALLRSKARAANVLMLPAPAAQ